MGILVKYKYSVLGHDCWGKNERDWVEAYKYYATIEEWLKEKTSKNYEFIELYEVVRKKMDASGKYHNI